MSAPVPDRPLRMGLDPVRPVVEALADAQVDLVGEARAFESLLRERRDATAIPEVQGATPAAPVAEAPLSLGMMRLTLDRLITRLEAMPDTSREMDTGLWALRAEQRKLAVLDGYVNGLIRG